MALAAARNTPPPQPPAALPDGLKIPSYAPGPIPFHQGEQLVFRASWIGIPAAEARIMVHGDIANPRLWSGEVWIRTSQLVDTLYRMRDYTHEQFSRGSLAPRDIFISHQENARKAEYRINFDRDDRLVTMVRRTKKHSDTSRFSADNPYGPISGALMALSQPLKVGQKYTFDVFSGRNRYVIALEVAGRERIQTGLGEMDALRIVPSLVYLSDEDARGKARETTIWISADQRHLPLRIEAAAFIGSLRADLVQVSEAAPPSPGKPQSDASAPR